MRVSMVLETAHLCDCQICPWCGRERVPVCSGLGRARRGAAPPPTDNHPPQTLVYVIDNNNWVNPHEFLGFTPDNRLFLTGQACTRMYGIYDVWNL